jgi:hypothetical protein
MNKIIWYNGECWLNDSYHTHDSAEINSGSIFRTIEVTFPAWCWFFKKFAAWFYFKFIWDHIDWGHVISGIPTKIKLYFYKPKFLR